MLVELEYENIVGYGEASMPPYLGETQETAAKFLSGINLEQFKNPFELETILSYVDAAAPGNQAAKAAIDIAFHDLIGKLLNKSWVDIWGYNRENTPFTSFTIGIDTPEIVEAKVKEAAEYKILKIKLGSELDKEIVETIIKVTDRPLIGDVNQGWNDKHYAIEMIEWCAENGFKLIEQPMPKEQLDDIAWLTERSSIPIFADESVQRLSDIVKINGAFDGINVKLMKSTGLREAKKMLELAKNLGLRLMLGCMTETSCAISAASHLAPLVEWADLDGALLIENDKFSGTTIQNGKIVIQDKPGIGVKKLF